MPPEPGRDEQAIRTLIADWAEATRAEDVNRVLMLMAQDVVFLIPGKAPQRGREAFGAELREVLRHHTIDSKSDVLEVEVAGSMAYCVTRLIVMATPKNGGEPMRRAGHSLSILRKGVDGVWRLTRDANLLAPV